MSTETYKKQNYQAGETIFKEGDPGDCAYIVQSGTVKVIKTGSSGKEVVIAKIGKGGIVGEMAIVEDAERFATVKAETKVELMMVARDTFQNRIESLDRFTGVLLKTLIDRLKTQSQKTVELAVRHVEQVNKANKAKAMKAKGKSDRGTDEISFESVDAILVDRNQITRSGMKSGFFQHGLRGIRDVSSFEAMLEEFKGKFFDVLILDSGADFDQACQIIWQIRHGYIGNNSFIVIIALADEGDKRGISRLKSVGADEVVTKPYSVNSMLEQLRSLVNTRRPFVVTNDYIGPDRQMGSENPSTNIPKFGVPNTLQLKVLHGADSVQLQNDVSFAENEINEQRVRRNIVQLAWLLERVDEANKGQKSPSSFFNRMAEVLNELSERGSKTDYAETVTQCVGMEGLVRELADIDQPSPADLAKLRNMAGSLADDILT
ncbi:MAG: cyclic nucleotide-binding domain-containing protein [Alphaproteobacteria bacterium]|nr:cyclic nucleotide-binding domain-containing protein [Rhodospirillales bacterium]MCW9046215.1 cyclic nucleotide-binding domain-containing protein [Alphaproteobacteria bacterium]